MFEHGGFAYRLPVDRRGTNETVGYSLWHLLAARMMDMEAALAFLDEANDQGINTLIDDLGEHMAVFPSSTRGLWIKYAPYQAAWTWPQFRAATAWKSPMEISKVVGLPLLPLSRDHWMIKELHPVIRAAHIASCQRLGLFPEDWWT